MIELSAEQLRRLQLVELELLKEFDRICRKHNIKYSITGGTLLGAVRHGGFIPWDDDSDVSMLRSEYEKFVAVCDSELDPEKYYFQDIDRTPGYRWGYGKLRRKDTVFLREHQQHMPYEQGIFMDIFPRDSVPDSYLGERIHSFKCFIVRKILWSAVGRFADSRSMMRTWFSILYHMTKRSATRFYHKLVLSSSDPETERVRALTFPIPRKGKGYLRKWYQEYTDINFEDATLMTEAGYLEWLTVEFDDYMELPPIEKRKVHPVVDIRFPDDV
ncbi:lipopolysaccharide cholinephosphotransferase [Lachnospiraceae bacterium XBB2008]|nr:lipopolysaccharide cholinephosphotransferase [Lachnospiraceae bacterium XBB2008]